MREIKFRAWDREKCRWLTAVEYESLRINPIQDRYGNGFNLNDCVGTGEMIDRVFYIEFIQFTGLRDKNGREIYESDRIKAEAEEGMQEWIIVFSDGRFSGENSRDHVGLHYWTPSEIEVIGNVHENGDLLNG